MLCALLGRGGASSERGKEPSPITLGIEDTAHLIAARSVTIKFPMLELNPSRSLTISDKSHLDFRIQIRVVLPVGVDVPRKHKSRGRLPRKDTAPVAGASIVTTFVPASPYPWLDDRVHRIGLADLVDRQGPSCTHLCREHPPCHR